MRVFALLALATSLQAASPVRTWEIPALSYGPNRWSVVKVTNRGDAPVALKVEAFDQRGAGMEVQPYHTLQARETVEIRIDKPSSKVRETCWARLTAPADANLEVRGFMEVLRENAIETFERELGVGNTGGLWLFDRKEIESKVFYFLNTTDERVRLSVCFQDLPNRSICPVSNSTGRYVLKAREAIALQLGATKRQYFVVQSEPRGRAMMVLLWSGPGDRKSFSSESTIQFGEPSQ